jgi:DNA-binding PadR family transcriptional regulator
MPKTANASGQRNHWALAVLALLREREMHPYEMRRLMRERNKEERLVLKAGSLYHAITWLERGSLIEAIRTERQGKRPERTTYRITKTGKGELLKWLKELIAIPLRESASFVVGLDHLVHLSPAEAAAQLEQRLKLLEPRLKEMDGVLQMLAPKIGRINLLEVEFEQALCQAEVSWLRQVVRDLRSGALAWDIELILRYLRAAAENRPQTRKRSVAPV